MLNVPSPRPSRIVSLPLRKRRDRRGWQLQGRVWPSSFEVADGENRLRIRAEKGVLRAAWNVPSELPQEHA